MATIIGEGPVTAAKATGEGQSHPGEFIQEGTFRTTKEVGTATTATIKEEPTINISSQQTQIPPL